MVPTTITKLLGKKTVLTPLALLITAAVILRIPNLFEPYWYGDEAIYLTLGLAARQGLVFYRDIFDHKPPLIYLVAQITGTLFWLKLFLLTWHITTITLFWELAKTFFQKNTKAIIFSSTIFTILTTLPFLEGNIANAELFMIGPTVAAILLIFSSTKPSYKHVFLSGLLFSTATLFKVPALFDMLAVLVFWTINSIPNMPKLIQSAKKSTILSIGFLIPILLSVIYYWLNGALAQYLSTAWFFNFEYIKGWGAPTLGTTQANNGLQTGLIFRTQIVGVVLLAIVIFKKRFNKTTLFSCIWFTLTIYAMLLSGRPYPHYIIQAIPPLAILATLLVFPVVPKQKYRFLTVPFLLLFIISLSFYKFGYYPTYSYYQNFLAVAIGQKKQEVYFANFDARVPEIYKLAQTISANTTQQDKIFIWGTAPELYALSQRVPPGRFTTSFHIKDLNAEEETLQAIKDNTPKYIIIILDEKGTLPGLDKILQENYIPMKSTSYAKIWRLTNPTITEKLNGN